MKLRLGALWLAVVSVTAMAQELPRIDPVPGGIAMVAVDGAEEAKPQAFFRGQRLLVVNHANHWHALVGLPLSMAPGSYQVTTIDTHGVKDKKGFTVQPKQYAVQRLTIKQQRFVDPTPDDLTRIKRDRKAIHAAFATWSEQSVASFRFRLPAQGRMSSPFGLKRFFNNQPRQPHSGVDIAAPRGAVVVAPASGRVLSTADYFFNGHTVFLDHGQGLISMFNHLDKYLVRSGERVSPGQPIGEIGMTGRVTGPHLHWSVSLNDSRVDPLLFVADDAFAKAEENQQKTKPQGAE